MDVDEGSVVQSALKSESLFAKSDELYVAFYANLPVEVKQILKNAGECRVFGAWVMAYFALQISTESRTREPSIL